MKNRETNAAVERVLKALANRRRIAIVRFLKTQKRATVGDIAEDIKLSVKSTSKHLAILAAADILEREQQSTFMYYSLAQSQSLSASARAVIAIL